MITNLLSTMFFLAGMIGLIVSVIIICKKENILQNLLLSLCLFALSCSCIYGLYTSSLNFYLNEASPLKSFAFIVAPCAYLYTKKTNSPSLVFKWYHSLNFLPALLYLIYTVTSNSQIANPNFWIVDYTTDFYAFNMLVSLAWLLYAYTQALITFTNTDKLVLLSAKKTIWLKCFSFLILSLFIGLFIQKVYGLSFGVNFNIINDFIISAILLGAGYVAFYKPTVFFDTKNLHEDYLKTLEVITEAPSINEVEHCKAQAIVLSDKKTLEYSAQIEKALIDKPYLKKGFVIRDLSELTDIPVHHLWHFINSYHNLYFQDFINKKRIEYLIQQLGDSEWKSLSLEGQAWAVGFKSRTTFFRAFTKLMGKSPSEYLNSLNEAKLKNYSATA